jgi:hypothetical protein
MERLRFRKRRQVAALHIRNRTPQRLIVAKRCELCAGTGDVTFFKGESRFLLSREECDACCGTGYVETQSETAEETHEDETDDAD